ncbi:MAG: multidrug efflux pump subunit AcrA (membrane-fusion protein) [Flavobacteriales bacterium]|jgi:multidrug efflux pump subunit AcrA (membrane-fusion protein)
MNQLMRKPLILFVMIAFGIVIAFSLVKLSAPVKHHGLSLPTRNVEVLSVQTLPFRAQVTAYGSVEPTISLKGKAEVSGRISYVHPKLKNGGSIAAGTVVVRIDASDYKVSLRQTEADLNANKQALLQLEEEEKSTQKSLMIARENLVFGEQEFARIQKIWERKLVSRSTLDAEKQKVNQLRQSVQELQGKINSFSSRKDSVKANIVRSEQQVKGQMTNLGRTEIILPFAARIGDVYVEENEFAAVGKNLFEALNTAGIEINAQLPILHMSALVSHLENVELKDLREMSSNDTAQMLNLTAKVSLVGGLEGAVWPAEVLRLSESVDAIRRTIGLVVGVNNPYELVVPGRRPPLLKGMYTAVKLRGPERRALVIPRKAVHENRVYLVGEESQLVIRNVDVQFYQNELAVIRSGLSEGDQLIVSDVYPVIEGMPVSAQYDAQTQVRLTTSAVGE